MNALVQQEARPIAAASQGATLGPLRSFDLSPQTFEQAIQFADMLARSDMVPKDYRGKPENCLISMQWGAEIGLKPMQAIQNIAVINGRPGLWGDAMIALVRASPLCEYIVEGWHEDGTAFCRVKRRGEPEQVREFSEQDARTAGLWGKQGPWCTSPKRMKQLRARAFALRDVFTDVLRGMDMAEALMDLTAEMQAGAPPTQELIPLPKPSAPKRDAWPTDSFEAQFTRWEKAVQAGLKSAADILAMASSKGELTQEQTDRINALQPATPTTAGDDEPPWQD